MQEMTKLAVEDRSAIIGSIIGCTILFAALLAAKLMWPVPAHQKPISSCPALEQGPTCRPS